MKKLYAGIGSRKTPPEILANMQRMATSLAEKGFILRSGGARGADKMFEIGCDKVEGKKEIFYAKDATEEALDHAAHFHPAWIKCNEWARALHGRNSMIVLGEKLDDPVDFIICWTPNGGLEGGTAQGLRIAISKDIKVYNLFNKEDEKELQAFIREAHADN